MGLFGKKSGSSPSQHTGMRDPVVVQGIGSHDGAPLLFETTVEAEDVWSKHMVTEAAKKTHGLNGRTNITRWGRKGENLDYS